MQFLTQRPKFCHLHNYESIEGGDERICNEVELTCCKCHISISLSETSRSMENSVNIAVVWD
jgi:hypothetical protein